MGVKSIQTRSGHRIVFTEDESIIITYKSGNEIHLDATGSNITITASETMPLNCKDMNINVGGMNTTVGMNIYKAAKNVKLTRELPIKNMGLLRMPLQEKY
ncbi:hypothetical protein [Chryseobacterium sp. c4a]|uniref:hypothetical protein n=1 Tax=Chryseobacterium sp. c4a TaxID=1573582 RepID=UPI001E4C7AAC|nr:hypothetical protein [Chryseobacterium sp. c4a]